MWENQKKGIDIPIALVRVAHGEKDNPFLSDLFSYYPWAADW